MSSRKKILAIVAIVALVALLGVCLAACNAESYAKKLQRKGYEVTVSGEGEDDAGLPVEWCVKGVRLSDTLPSGGVTVRKYKNLSDAKMVESSVKEIMGKGYAHRIDRIVIQGTTRQAVKDAK